MRRGAVLGLLLAVSACLAALPWAADASSLKLPPGAKVAIVMFEDLQCPDCAKAYPMVWETAKTHHIPVVLHDFPLPKHNWSFRAAVFARHFDLAAPGLGNEYRAFIYHAQNQIADEDGLESYTEQFADEHKLVLPVSVDPEGKLAAKVRADYELGQKIGIEYTPTIFVIGPGAVSTPFVEVVDRAQLGQIVDDMLKKAGAAAPVKSAGKKKAS